MAKQAKDLERQARDKSDQGSDNRPWLAERRRHHLAAKAPHTRAGWPIR